MLKKSSLMIVILWLLSSVSVFAQGAAVEKQLQSMGVLGSYQVSNQNQSVQAPKPPNGFFIAARIRSNQEFLYAEIPGAQASIQLAYQKPSGGLVLAAAYFKNITRKSPVDRLEFQAGYDFKLKQSVDKTRVLLLSPRVVYENFLNGLKVVAPELNLFTVKSLNGVTTIFGVIAQAPLATRGKTNGPRIITTANQTRKLNRYLGVVGEIQFAGGPIGPQLKKEVAVRGLAGVSIRLPGNVKFQVTGTAVKASGYDPAAGLSISLTNVF